MMKLMTGVFCLQFCCGILEAGLAIGGHCEGLRFVFLGACGAVLGEAGYLLPQLDRKKFKLGSIKKARSLETYFEM